MLDRLTCCTRFDSVAVQTDNFCTTVELRGRFVLHRSVASIPHLSSYSGSRARAKPVSDQNRAATADLHYVGPARQTKGTLRRSFDPLHPPDRRRQDPYMFRGGPTAATHQYRTCLHKTPAELSHIVGRGQVHQAAFEEPGQPRVRLRGQTHIADSSHSHYGIEHILRTGAAVRANQSCPEALQHDSCRRRIGPHQRPALLGKRHLTDNGDLGHTPGCQKRRLGLAQILHSLYDEHVYSTLAE